MNQQDTIFQILVNYLNLAGYSLFASFLMMKGLSILLPQKATFSKKSVFGLFLIIFAILFILQKVKVNF